MQNRLARIFRPESGRTVMLAFDHGYFQGPTTGLERVDLNIVPLAPYADALMLTRGHPALRRSRRRSRGGVVMRASGGPSILKELSNEQLAVDIEDAIRLNVPRHGRAGLHRRRVRDPVASQNMTRLVDAGNRYGIPVLGVTAVGKELTRDARYLRLATRICAELGAPLRQDLLRARRASRRVTAGCPVPIVMAGGKKLPELEALTMAYRRDRPGRRRRRHGPQHLPVRRAGRDDPGRRDGRARRRRARGEAHELYRELREGRALAETS